MSCVDFNVSICIGVWNDFNNRALQWFYRNLWNVCQIASDDEKILLHFQCFVGENTKQSPIRPTWNINLKSSMSYLQT